MRELIDEALSVRGVQYISCNNGGKYFWSNKRKYNTNVDKSQLIDMINYLGIIYRSQWIIRSFANA